MCTCESQSQTQNSPTSLKSRRPIPSVTVTKTVPPEEATSHLRPTWYTRGSGCHPTRGAWGSSDEIPSRRKLVVGPPAEKKISSSRRELPALLLFPGDLSPPQSDHAPLFKYIDAPSGPSKSSHTCRSWQRAVGPNVCILREAGLDARANAVASSPALPLGVPQAIATRRL